MFRAKIAPEAINIATRNQVIERLKSHQVGLFRTFLERWRSDRAAV